MNWLELIAGLALFVGLGGATFLVAQRPDFWVGLAMHLGKAAWPLVLKYMTKRMPPEEEAEWRKAQMQGRGDEWARDWMRRKRK